MRPKSFLLALLTALLAVPVKASPRDLAELFPANSLIFAEIAQPAETVKQLAAFFKGTALENALPVLNKIREKQQPNMPLDIGGPGILSALLGPEALHEAGRIEGIAAALTGFNQAGEPLGAVVVLTGETQLPGLMMRGFLCADSDLRKIGVIEGVELYQKGLVVWLNLDIDGPNPVAPPKQDVRHMGPVFAYQPGFILMASDKDTAAATIRRFKRLEKSKSLAANGTFKPIASQRVGGGLFVYASAKPLLERFAPTPASRSEPEPYLAAVLRKWLPPAGIESLSARLQLNEHGFDFRGALKVDPQAHAPLADFVAGPMLSSADLNGIGQESLFAVALKFPAGDQRLEHVLALLDPLIKASGTLGPSASEMARDLEEKKILPRATLAKIHRLVVALPPIDPKTPSAMPTILVEADDESSMSTMTNAVPAILHLLTEHHAEPVTETVDGVKVRTVEAKTTPLGVPIYYAQHGKSLAIGTNRQSVVACLRADPARSVAAIPEVADLVKTTGSARVFGVLNWGQVLPPTVSAKADEKLKTVELKYDLRIEAPSAQAPAVSPLAAATLMRGMPPLVFALGREQDELRFEIRQLDPHCLRAKAIERWFEWKSIQSREFYQPGLGGAPFLPAVER